jgi:hypothetical protein
MAAQFTLMKGLSRRTLFWYSSLAISSFPVPDSPVISTVTSVWATVRTSSITDSMAPLR